MTRKTLNKKSKIQKSKRNIKTLKKSKKETTKPKKNYKTKNKNTRSKKRKGGDVNAHLATASQQGNLLAVQSLLKKDNLFGIADINKFVTTKDGRIIGTPLYLASENGHLGGEEFIKQEHTLTKELMMANPLLASLNGHKGG